jgi:hypothetical protein
MRNVILAFCMTVFGMASANASDFFTLKEDVPDIEGTVRFGSEFVYRGVSLGDDVSAGLDLRASNILISGLFVSSKMDTYRLSPLNDSTQVRTDLGVGLGFILGGVLDVEASIHRVHNPNFNAPSYNEPRVKVGYDVFYVEGAYNEANGNYYTALGVDYPLGFVPGLTVGGLVSGIDYGATDTYRFNNAQVYLNYNVWNDLDLIGAYSYGGEDAFGNDRKNEAWVTAQYRF